MEVFQYGSIAHDQRKVSVLYEKIHLNPVETLNWQVGVPDVDRILLQRAGLKVEEKTPHEQIKPVKCWHCGAINTPTAQFCVSCGMGLTEGTRAQTISRQEMIEVLYKGHLKEKQKTKK